ncbi:MAG: ATP-binding protein [Proteobacteria bacterium]|nr:ATP-binding protein [Pseudomonadota bacterium]
MKAHFFEQILENLPYGTVYLSYGKVVYVNSTVESILGLSKQKLLSLNIEELRFPKKLAELYNKSKRENKTLKLYEEPFINYLGNNYLLNFFLIPISLKDESFLLLVEDCSFLKSMEASKYEKQNIEKLSILFASMAHEIKNPLGVIKGIIQLMTREKESYDEEAFKIIFSELDRIEKIIQDLLDYSNPQLVHIDNFSIIDLINEATGGLLPVVKEKNLLILKEYDSTIPKIFGDRESLYKAVFNVIKNSVEASYIGGKIDIRVRVVVDIKYKEKNRDYSYLLIEVEDSGEGVREEDIQKLFTPFFTTKPKGTGLGLVYSQKVVMEHNGFMKIKSEYKRGTKVSIYLPMKDSL